ncbi:DUF4129 domain-containing protein [Archangium primigenium]|uniref:DUF4129 domain-containing protein n=1 Tax=[Archangium] primigenium TaxID=2792470 RepID=UPI001956B302|nr:DUF4129 domain-containing protein [Archangium primigenium]MBM7115894.1 DUF4129 domain-containing protein [Archangium primigenium]
MGPALLVVWLGAALPCPDAPRELQHLSDAATQGPDALAGALADLEARWGGPPLGESVETARQRLRAVCASLQTAAPPRATDAARLQEILARPEFAHARQRQGDALDRLLRWVKDWLEELLQTREAQSFATSTRFVVLALGFAVVLLVALRLRHWKRAPSRTSAATAPAERAGLKLDAPGEHLSRARAALAAQPRTAIREGLLALLSSLEARRYARPDRVRTNRELVEELPERGAPAHVTGEVERLVRWYDQAFYSLAPVPGSEAARFVSEVERLHQGLAGGAA